MFTCRDGTVFVLDKIIEVGPIIDPCTGTQVPFRFLVQFIGGSHAAFPSEDCGHLLRNPNGEIVGVMTYSFADVTAVRDLLLKVLDTA